jgi:membrane protein insertase, YidC/Oxa1 family, C-terminal domain
LDNSSKEEKILITLLTPTGGILGPIASLLGIIMNAIYMFFNIFGIHNIALSIFMFTFIMRAAMLPLTIKQQKFQKLSSRMNPELQKIQAKYKGKKDEVSLRKMQAENSALYEKYGANPTSGCLPVIIQLPIMFALYYVISNVPAYVGKVKEMYQPVADKIIANSDFANTVLQIAKTDKLAIRSSNISDSNHIINILAKFGTDQWKELSAQAPQLSEIIHKATHQINSANNFFGMNIANRPGFLLPAVLIPFIAAGLQFIQAKQMQVKTQDSKDNPAAAAMNSMNIVMPLMSLFFCFTFPIGIGLYWIAGSVFAIVQQYFVNKYMDKVDVDVLIEKNVSKAAKKSKHLEPQGMKLQDIAKKQTKSIENSVTEQIEVNNETVTDVNNSENSNAPKSISDIANLLKNKNL